MLQSHSQYKYNIGVFVCLQAGCRSSVAERLWVKQAVLGSNPIGYQI